MPRSAERQLDPVVQQSFAMHARAEARLVEQVDRRLLEHAGADAAEHVFAAAALEDDVVDAGVVQQLAEEQARGTCADDRDLGARGRHGGAIIAAPAPARSCEETGVSPVTAAR